MGASQTSTTNQTQTQTANPITANVVGGLLPRAFDTANTAYNQNMSPQVAALTPMQQQAIQQMGGLGSNNPASPFIQQANQYSQTAADPNSVVRMQQQFFNPMASAVEAQLGNVFGQQNAQLLGNAAASGAIGGSRYGVAAGNLANQQGLAAGQTLAGLQQQALQAAQTEQGQISQQAFTQGQLGNEALNTQIAGIQQALQAGTITQQQAQQQLNAIQQGAVQQTLWSPQMLSMALNQAGAGALLGGTTTGQGTTTQPVNYLGQIIGGGLAGVGLMGGVPGVQKLFGYAEGGAIKKRAIGGGTGVGLGDEGISALAGVPSQGGLNFNGVQSGLSPYFAQSPQVHAVQPNFPQLNLNPQNQNTAQQQSDAGFKQALDFAQQGQKLGQQFPMFGGTADFGDADAAGVLIGKAHGGRVHRQSGGPVASGFPQSIADAIQKHPDATSIKQGPDGGHQIQLQNGIGIKYPGQKQAPNSSGRVHRDDGGPVEQDVTAQPSISDFIQRRVDQKYPIPPSLGSNAIVDPNAPAQASIASVNPVTMGNLSPTPGPQQYISLDYQGRQVGGPQPAEADPALIQRAPIQQAAFASPAQTSQPVPPAPIAQPAQPSNQPWTPQRVAQSTIDIFRGGGASDNAIRGILVNYNDESGLNPGLRHWDQPHFVGEAAYAHGLAQEGGGEWNRYSSWLSHTHPNADWRDPNLQNQFLLWNLQTNYPKVWEAMNNAPTGEQAAQAFLHGYLKPSFANEQRRSEQYGRGVPGLDDLVKNAGTANFSANRSVLDRPDLQPPKPGESNLAALMKNMFGMDMTQPQGLGGSLGRALGQNPSLSDQASNRLVNAGLAMMATPPTVGVKGFPGAAISALNAAGRGGLGALNQEQSERQQAIQLANAAMNQELHRAQMANYQREATQPRQIASKVIMDDYGQPHVVPVMGQPPGVKPEEQWKAIPNTEPGSQTTRTGLPDLDTIPRNVTGDDFVKEAKKAGYPPNLVDSANEVANYKDDPSKLASMRGHERVIIDRLAHRINPDYDMQRYPAVAAAEKNLRAGNVAKSLSSIGRLFDEVEIAADKADATHNWGSENANAVAGKVYPSNSEYQRSRTALGTAINNVGDAAAAAAKGGSQGAEGDARRRVALMNPDMHPNTLKAGLYTEVETALKMGQSNLTPYNEAHGYTPDSPKYQSIMDHMTPNQQKKAVKMLGADKIEEITGRPVPANIIEASKAGKSAAPAIPSRPINLPVGSQYNPELKQWRDPEKRIYDLNGNPING